MTTAGLLAGIPCSLAVSSFLRNLLFAVSASDPVTLGTVAAILAIASIAAAFFPARRAASVDPVTALRAE